MKFLCVPCDTPMRLEQTRQAEGSVSLVYACPACGYECAMLTNTWLGLHDGRKRSPSRPW